MAMIYHTTEQQRAFQHARQEMEATPEKEVTKYTVFGEKPPKVEFEYSDGSKKVFDGRNWHNVK
jgi:hypothetical protein